LIHRRSTDSRRNGGSNVIKAVLFDFHNTLVEADRWLELEIRTMGGEAWALLEARGALRNGHEGPEAADRVYHQLRLEIQERGREMDAVQSILATIDRLGGSADPSDVARVVDELQRGCLAEARLQNDALATLRQLKDEGYHLGIVSSAAYSPFVLWSLDRFELMAYFETVVTSSDSGYYKTNPEIWWQALANLDIPPEKGVHVGDSFKWDVLGAKRAGLRAVWIKRGSVDGADESAADAVIDSLHQLPAYVHQW
jgi:HAD superfamily hydrolase (TIGR01509 family)